MSTTVTPTGSGRGRPGYAREDVIRIAVEEFNARGYEATSMGALAERLGLSKSAIYHHIASKEEILVEATDKALEELTAVVEGALAETADPVEQLRLLIGGTTRVLCEYPAYVRLLLRLRGNTDAELAIMARRRVITRALVDVVKRAQEEGSLRTDLEAGVVARLIFGMINSIVEWYNPEGRYAPADLESITPEMVFTGIVRSRA
ncbi:transcriptional regulator [Corynebacterium humireducens NBRC 106098 = DSM 45392]|uniref:Transcriptional regulator n=1 Tax=Corynebacterium humireducens NBRC 106098 = DSM 45392 TaxID=1223515 RepID=A0A0B5DBL6_9CORY|nr:TetR/AcrR family transcriptional regulator [Corynebacterium humireducens]AJE34337.1 transcriptional regulator [Corynebacterium humireducens NBRC 106098 = DSM 45392]